MSIQLFFRLVGMGLFGWAGWAIADAIDPTHAQTGGSILLILAGVAIGATVAPYLSVVPFAYLRRRVRMLPAIDLIAGSIGLVIGLLVSVLLTVPLAQLPGFLGRILPFAAAILFSYLGMSIMVMRKREIFEFFGVNKVVSTADTQNPPGAARPILVDTSAVIDGRIADISQTGFVEGTLIIPRFVLNELQHIADSPDALRRNRGRRGLDMLKKLQKDSLVPIEISDIDAPDVAEVDGKLVKLAKINHFPVMTNDFNLNRVAELQGVKVLNINELANAVKPVVLPTEELVVKVTQEGKEASQGVAYLDDGTMIVIENGRRYIGQEVNVSVTRVLQTVAGRMIFAQLKNGYTN